MRLLPPIKRARDFYLYDEKGRRFLDLYLDGGRALCGHRPNGLSNVLKNTISRGLYAPYPSVYSNRLDKVLKQGFPRFAFREVYRSTESFEKAFGGPVHFSDPAKAAESGESSLWRPFLPVSEGCERLLVQFPYPGVDAVAILSRKDNLPPSDYLSPVTESGLVRSWFDLQIRLEQSDRAVWPLLDDTGHWERTGPYLNPLCAKGEYGDLFRLYLDQGVLISPYCDKPSVIAVDIKEGSLKKLKKALKGDRHDQ